jgi:hypothetical protein
MNHNPLNLQPGETVVLDKEFRNTSEVVIQGFTPLKMYATVHKPGEPDKTWQVMTGRLTPKT